MNPSLPYTGSSSASFATQQSKEVADKQEKLKRESADKRSALLPSEEIITKEYDDMIAEAKDLTHINVKSAIAVGNNALEIQLLAKEELVIALQASKMRLLNALRDNKS